MATNPVCSDFCDYMARYHLLPMEVIVELRRGTRAPQLGKILLDRRAMDVRQVMQIVSLQADEPRMRFGELAIRAGFIDEHELISALRDQRMMRRHPSEIILERGLMKRSALLRALIGYTTLLEGEFYEPEGAPRRGERAAPQPAALP